KIKDAHPAGIRDQPDLEQSVAEVGLRRDAHSASVGAAVRKRRQCHPALDLLALIVGKGQGQVDGGRIESCERLQSGEIVAAASAYPTRLFVGNIISSGIKPDPGDVAVEA